MLQRPAISTTPPSGDSELPGPSEHRSQQQQHHQQQRFVESGGRSGGAGVSHHPRDLVERLRENLEPPGTGSGTINSDRSSLHQATTIAGVPISDQQQQQALIGHHQDAARRGGGGGYDGIVGVRDHHHRNNSSSSATGTVIGPGTMPGRNNAPTPPPPPLLPSLSGREGARDAAAAGAPVVGATAARAIGAGQAGVAPRWMISVGREARAAAVAVSGSGSRTPSPRYQFPASFEEAAGAAPMSPSSSSSSPGAAARLAGAAAGPEARTLDGRGRVVTAPPPRAGERGVGGEEAGSRFIVHRAPARFELDSSRGEDGRRLRMQQQLVMEDGDAKANAGPAREGGSISLNRNRNRNTAAPDAAAMAAAVAAAGIAENIPAAGSRPMGSSSVLQEEMKAMPSLAVVSGSERQQRQQQQLGGVRGEQDDDYFAAARAGVGHGRDDDDRGGRDAGMLPAGREGPFGGAPSMARRNSSGRGDTRRETSSSRAGEGGDIVEGASPEGAKRGAKRPRMVQWGGDHGYLYGRGGGNGDGGHQALPFGLRRRPAAGGPSGATLPVPTPTASNAQTLPMTVVGGADQLEEARASRGATGDDRPRRVAMARTRPTGGGGGISSGGSHGIPLGEGGNS